MRILGIDVGTTAVAAAVLDVATATPVGPIARTPLELDHPTPEAVELTPERLWSALTSASRQAMRGVETVNGIGLASVAPALLLLDAKDQPLTPIWLPLDRRSRAAARQVRAGAGEEMLTTTGNRPLPGGISAICYRQILNDTPYLFRRVRRYLHVSSWLGLCLTGKAGMDSASASLSGLYNTLTDHQWSPRWCDFFNVEPSWLPTIVRPSATLGSLRPAVAAELGVPPGIPVKLGTTDTASTVLAATMKPGDLLHCIGSTQTLASLVASPAPDARRLIQHLGEDYLYLTHNPVGSAALAWLHRLCYRDLTREQFDELLLQEALKHETRVSLDPPHLGGDSLEIEAHRASFRDLTLATDRLDLLAALLREMRRQHLRAFDALGVAGPFGRVFLTGEDVEIVRRLLPEYERAVIQPLEEGPLRGIASLFSER